MSLNSIEVFEKNLSIYHKIIQYNLMQHRSIENLLNNLLTAYPSKINILDLGCSDGYFYKNIFSTFDFEHYWGYDLSPHSIELVEKNKVLKNAKFFVGDICDFDTQLPLCHFIFAGYVIHHLNVDEKIKLFSKIINQLQVGGKFLMVDIFKTETQTLQDYYQNYAEIINQYPNVITSEDKAIIYKHVSNNDFPESVEFWQKLSTQFQCSIVNSQWFQAPQGFILFQRL